MSELEYDDFERALSAIVTARVAQIPFVKSFREEILDGKLLDPVEVSFWLYIRSEDPDEEPVDEDEFPCFVPEITGFGPDFRLIRKGSTIHELYDVAVELERICPVFEKPDLVDLILTGCPPPLHRMLMVADKKDRSMPANTSRMQIFVDPLVSSNELEEFYAAERSRFWKVDRSSAKRNKPMTPKHLTLAVFLENNGEKLSSHELREKWNSEYPNSEYPDWNYDDKAARNFIRDARSAWERVTGDQYSSSLLETYRSTSIVWSALGRKAKHHVADLKGVGWRAWGYIDDDGNLEVKRGSLPKANIPDVKDYLLRSDEIDLRLSPGKVHDPKKEYIRFETLATINGDKFVVKADLRPPKGRRLHMVIAAWDVTPVNRMVVPAPQTTIRQVEAQLPGVIMEHPELRDTPIGRSGEEVEQ